MRIRLRELRRVAGISQEVLSRRSGVSRAMIWRIENGTRRNPGIQILARLAAVLVPSTLNRKDLVTTLVLFLLDPLEDLPPC